ncbi:sigma-54 interaction domain-containing protein [Vibrio scophthalmi]|uniref:Anaerobic nitric oxide reductase transcription regulator NorR n=1 Tax=Vibrio scophthalmi TaxID=45658 RepID=A0A1C7FJG4_9VIBR|nr:sigma-54 dependent transcriptional regulator [Vibrio scophthalmi]ANU39454.1 Anaerobic nitric oxide reductase transcription regulator NorR [Vibrio scophthalmi]
MSQWLTFATDLVGVRKSHQLESLFVDLINKGMKLKDCLLLKISSDGRNLVPHHFQCQYAWSVTDFEVPFAHVLQSIKTMHLTVEELLFWRSNSAFSQLTENIGIFDSLCILPLKIGDRQVHSILLLMGDKQIVSNICEDAGFVKFIDVFSQQRQLLLEIEQEEQTSLEIKESLNDIQRDSIERSLANNLSMVLIGESVPMKKLREQIVSAANSQLSVMVQGDTGTGKELVAAAIHDLSSRQSAPLIAVNCAAIPEHLLESELFGYCKGAFSGADSDKQGLIAQADGGTLFLDEIGDMSITLQAKLLRVLETRSFRPLGGKQELSSDFRLVSATYVNLLEHVRQKTFRQDLYYRLFQYPISLPSLAERLDDLDLLCNHFVRMFNHQHGTNIRGLNYRALDCLKKYDFPGNVRELKYLVEFGCTQTLDGTEVEVACFAHRINSMHYSDLQILEMSPQMVTTLDDPHTESFVVIHDLKQALNEYEAIIITERLTHFAGDRAKAAESLGIPKRTLAYKCQKLEIKA